MTSRHRVAVRAMSRNRMAARALIAAVLIAVASGAARAQPAFGERGFSAAIGGGIAVPHMDCDVCNVGVWPAVVLRAGMTLRYNLIASVEALQSGFASRGSGCVDAACFERHSGSFSIGSQMLVLQWYPDPAALYFVKFGGGRTENRVEYVVEGAAPRRSVRGMGAAKFGLGIDRPLTPRFSLTASAELDYAPDGTVQVTGARLHGLMAAIVIALTWH